MYTNGYLTFYAVSPAVEGNIIIIINRAAHILAHIRHMRHLSSPAQRHPIRLQNITNPHWPVHDMAASILNR